MFAVKQLLLAYARQFGVGLTLCIQPLYILCGTAGEPAEWCIMVYMAADNDLRGFAAGNIKQMAEIGSSYNLIIVVELHIRLANNQKVTRRYYIEKGKVHHVNANDPYSQKLDSGIPETLVSFVEWATATYPAKKRALVAWNHGTGPLDPHSGRVVNSTELFTYNAEINKFELNRTIGFLDFMNLSDTVNRGVCWDFTTGNYLTNPKLEFALKQIKETCLNDQKLDLLIFDACLMSSLEIANLAKDYVKVLVSSQEVVLGTGLNYQTSFNIFQNNNIPDEKAFAQNIVKEFGRTYNPITNDYTMAAMDLSLVALLEDNINDVAIFLMQCLKKQKSQSVYNAIKASRDKRVCTHFDEPTFIDLHHFYKNIQANLSYFNLTDSAEERRLKQALNHALEEGCTLINQVVFANVCGKNLRLARGISIYFPENLVHSSYLQTKFAATNQWVSFLKMYLNPKRG